jgi:hypothetical protein
VTARGIILPVQHPSVTLFFSDLALSIPVWSCVETRHAGQLDHFSPCLVASPAFVRKKTALYMSCGPRGLFARPGVRAQLAVASSRRSICDVSSPTQADGLLRFNRKPSTTLICPSSQTSYAPAAASTAAPRNDRASSGFCTLETTGEWG